MTKLKEKINQAAYHHAKESDLANEDSFRSGAKWMLGEMQPPVVAAEKVLDTHKNRNIFGLYGPTYGLQIALDRLRGE